MPKNPNPEKNAWAFSKLLIAVASAAAIFLLSLTPLVRQIESRLLDLAFIIRGPLPTHPDILIIGIDDKSLSDFKSWPWPRSFHAKLLQILEPYKPSVIFFDIMFAEKSSSPNDDALLAEEIAKSGHVVLPFYFSHEEKNPKKFLAKASGLPIPAIQKSARNLGYANAPPDHDGNIRSFKLQHLIDGKTYEHISMVIAKSHAGPDIKIPKDINLQDDIIINFPGRFDQFKAIAYPWVLKQGLTPKLTSNLDFLGGRKIILVGFTASGVALDVKPTPFQADYPGVGTLASMIDTILQNRFIHKLPALWHFILLLLTAAAVVSICYTLNPARAFLYTTALILILFCVRQIAFTYFNLWFPFFDLFILASLLYTGITLLQFVMIRMESEVLSRELSLASKIQKNFLPSDLPAADGIELAAVTYPARQVGGDLYDVLKTADSVSYEISTLNQLGICIGDVSGKGVPAALFMAKAISEFRREALGSPCEVMQRVNRKISEGGYSGLFLTLLYLIIDPINRAIRFSNGGHEPIFHFQNSKRSVSLLKTDLGTPLGIDPESAFDEKTAQAESGDFMLLISDGIKEAMNSKREIFGNERIEKALIECAAKPPQEIIDHLLLRIRDFVKDAPQHDDMTLVCIKFT